MGDDLSTGRRRSWHIHTAHQGTVGIPSIANCELSFHHLQIVDVMMMGSNASIAPPPNHESIIHKHVSRRWMLHAVETANFGEVRDVR